MLRTVKAVIATTVTAMNKAELVKETSSPPIWRGTIRSMTNWCRGETCSSATLVLFFLFRVPLRSPADLPVSNGGAHASHRAEHIEHASSDAQQQKHHKPPGFGPECPIERPTDAEA